MEANPLTAEELAAIRERESKATPGKWMVWTSDSWRSICSPMGDSIIETVTYSETDRHPDLHAREEDLEFAAEARTDIPRLLATVEALRAENERLAKTLKESLMLLHRYTKSSAHDAQIIREWMERTGAASQARMSILREEPEA